MTPYLALALGSSGAISKVPSTCFFAEERQILLVGSDGDDVSVVSKIVRLHLEYTESKRTREVLHDWGEFQKSFRVDRPKDPAPFHGCHSGNGAVGGGFGKGRLNCANEFGCSKETPRSRETNGNGTAKTRRRLGGGLSRPTY